MPSAVQVALIQSAPVVFNLPATLEKTRQLCLQAAEKGAQVTVFPEAFISGYPKGADFWLKLGTRGAAGRVEFQRYWDSAITVPGPEVDFLAEVAASCQTHLVIGVIEKDLGTLYCSVLFFAPDGTYLGKHRKLMPTALERTLWGQGDGSTMDVFETAVGRLGAAICWENYMPLLRYHYYSQGIQIYCAPTVDEREQWISTMRHIALEGRCFVLSCCQFATRADFPDNDTLNISLDQDPLIRGGSCIINPLGEFLVEPVYGHADILTARLDLNQIPQGKFDLDVVGHYARPDIFQLTVNTK